MIGASALTLGLLEVVARSVYEAPWYDRLLENQRISNFRYATTIDNLRDKTYASPKPEGSQRVLLLGDSFTVGQGVPDREKIFAEIIERRLDASPPAALRDAAFALKLDEVSPAVRVDTWYHILKLEQRISPPNVRYEDVRDQVEKTLRDKIISSEMTNLATNLFHKARIRVLHPKLKQEFEKLLKGVAAEGATGP